MLEESEPEEQEDIDDPFADEERVGLADDESIRTSENFEDSEDHEMMLNKDKLKAKAKFAGVDPETGEYHSEESEEGETTFDK